MHSRILVAFGLLAVLSGCKRPSGHHGPAFDVATPFVQRSASLAAGDGVAHAFTVDVPKGLESKPSALGASLDFDDPTQAFLSPVSVHLNMTMSPASLTAAAKYVEIDPSMKVTEKKEQNPSDPAPDWTLTASSGSSWIAKSMHRTANVGIECSAQYIGATPSDAAKMQALLTRICSSVKPAAPGITAAEAAAAKAGPIEADASAFLAMFNGKSSGVAAALKKFGAKGLATHDMADYSLSDPKVVGSSKSGTATCYDVVSSAGMTKRGYTLCFENGKLQKVTPLGSNGLLPPGS